MKSIATALGAVLVLSACATSRVTPVRPAATGQPDAKALAEVRRICVIENPRVKPEFLDAYRSALSARGYEAVVFKKTPPSAECPLTSRYTAHWAWDLVFYLSYAELQIYREGTPAGRAEFRARGSRLIDTEAKVKELVNQMLPN